MMNPHENPKILAEFLKVLKRETDESDRELKKVSPLDIVAQMRRVAAMGDGDSLSDLAATHFVMMMLRDHLEQALLSNPNAGADGKPASIVRFYSLCRRWVDSQAAPNRSVFRSTTATSF